MKRSLYHKPHCRSRSKCQILRGHRIISPRHEININFINVMYCFILCKFFCFRIGCIIVTKRDDYVILFLYHKKFFFLFLSYTTIILLLFDLVNINYTILFNYCCCFRRGKSITCCCFFVGHEARFQLRPKIA